MKRMNLKSAKSIDRSVMRAVKSWAEDRSKDPSTKVGAAIYDPVTGALYLGYNGFPPGFPDDAILWTNRDPSAGACKYDLVIHAEVNAVRKARRGGADLSRCTIYCTHVPCPACMRDVIAAEGIRRVVYETFEYASNGRREEEVRNFIAQAMSIKIEKLETLP